MPQLQQVLKQIEELDPVEREKLVFALSEEMLPLHPLILRQFLKHNGEEYPSIIATPTVCGGSARLIRTRIPVWVIERMTQLGISDSDILRSYPALRAEDLVQARAYASRHPEEIEKEIRENEEA